MRRGGDVGLAGPDRPNWNWLRSGEAGEIRLSKQTETDWVVVMVRSASSPIGLSMADFRPAKLPNCQPELAKLGGEVRLSGQTYGWQW